MPLSTRSLWIVAVVLITSGAVLLFVAGYAFRAACPPVSSPCPGVTCNGPEVLACVGAWTPLAVGLVVMSGAAISGGVASAVLGQVRRVASTA